MASQTVVSLIVIIVAQLLNLANIDFGGNEQLTTTIENVVTIMLGIYAWYRHVALKKEVLGGANVNALGGTKKPL